VTLEVSSEDQNAARNTEREDCIQKVSGGSEDSNRNWTSGHSHYILFSFLFLSFFFFFFFCGTGA
jgi:hypothetical protein